MFKKVVLFIVLIIFIFEIKDVYAQTTYDVIDEHGQWISNEYVNKAKNGSVKYQQMSMIIRKSDGRFLYCIEPGKSIESNKTFTGYDDDIPNRINISNDLWIRIKLLAYYGYGYVDDHIDHSDIKWYVITQFMIWKTNNLGYDIYFTDRLNGNRIDKYIDEMNELDNLVNSHFVVPSFANTSRNQFVGDVVEYYDENDVLEKFDYNCKDINYCVKYLNYFDVKLEKDVNTRIEFTKRLNRFTNEAVVYIDDVSQNLLLPGKVPPVLAYMDVKNRYGEISLTKYDKATNLNKPQNDASLKDAEYGLYTDSNSLLEIRKTDDDGKLKFETKLDKGNYYVKEIKPSKGYNLDTTKYNVKITTKNYLISLKVYEDIIKEEFEIIKVIKNDKTGISEFEKNIEFGIYDSNDKLINKYITDDYGTFKFFLNYGDYTLKQHTVYDNYEMIDNYHIFVRENSKYNKLVFQDNLKKEISKRQVVDNEESIIINPNIDEENDPGIIEVLVPNTYKDDLNISNLLIYAIIKKLWLF